jgi:hypothetical protein
MITSKILRCFLVRLLRKLDERELRAFGYRDLGGES